MPPALLFAVVSKAWPQSISQSSGRRGRASNWCLEHRFKPNKSQATRERKLAGLARAVKGVLASDEGG
ncbi:hypothetical protein Q3C01_12855 [Bradyrhizobium sp. UFLA05-109]